jgi:predicted nucleic acid-binding protein
VSFLLDTNVISELRKSPRRADARVRGWVASHDASSLYLSAITLMEIEIGIGRLARRDHIQADRLRTWLDGAVLAVFAGRILPVDLAVARRVARLHVPDPRPERDAMIAATATVHGLSVVTRNVADFEALDVALIDPWSVPADD